MQNRGQSCEHTTRTHQTPPNSIVTYGSRGVFRTDLLQGDGWIGAAESGNKINSGIDFKHVRQKMRAQGKVDQ
jgi:hypothetical protein